MVHNQIAGYGFKKNGIFIYKEKTKLIKNYFLRRKNTEKLSKANKVYIINY